jgi:hypothetical protein
MEELKVIAKGQGELSMSGALTVENAGAILKRIRGALAQTDNLLITVGEEAETDISFLQILCSAHRTAVLQNKCFRVNTKNPRAFENDVRAAGYGRSTGCSRDHDGSCLWARGTK